MSTPTVTPTPEGNETESKPGLFQRMRSWPRSRWIKIIITLLVIAGIFILIAVAGRRIGPVLINALEDIRQQGFVGMLLFAGLYVVVTVSLLPASVLTIGAGVIWGVFIAAPIVIVSATLGSTAAFFAARYLLRDYIHRKLDGLYPDWRYIDAAIAKNKGLRINILVRLSPVVPFNILNWGLGTTSMSIFDQVVGTFIGIIPGTVLYTYIGSTLSDIAMERERDPLELVFWIIAGIITIITLVYCVKLARKALREALDAEKKEMNDQGNADLEAGSGDPSPPTEPESK